MTNMIRADDFLTIASFIMDADRDEINRVMFIMASIAPQAMVAAINGDTWQDQVVEMIRAGACKITVIKAVRNSLKIPLKEAKDAVEQIAAEHGLTFGSKMVWNRPDSAAPLTLGELLQAELNGNLAPRRDDW